jgi:hypothetical protein
MSRLFARVKSTTRIPIEGFAPDLTWIEVREEISIGEERRIFAGAIKGQTALKDGETRTEYDAQAISFGQVIAYLTDWDAKGENGKSVECTPDLIKGLMPEVYHAIEEAVKTHVEATREKKATPAQMTNDEPTLRAVAG